MSNVSDDRAGKLASMISVRFTEDEEAALRTEASKRGESVSTFIRQSVLRQVRFGDFPVVQVFPSTHTVAVGMTLGLERGQLRPAGEMVRVEPLRPGG